MGYYNGTGIVVGGGRDVTVAGEFTFHGGGSVYSEDTYTTKRYLGVNFGVALSLLGNASHSSIHGYRVFTKYRNEDQFGHWSTGSDAAWAVIPNVEGSYTKVSYSRIGDSNLFEVDIEQHDKRGRIGEGGGNTEVCVGYIDQKYERKL